MPIYIGLDIGGTKLMVAAANENGEILRRTRRETPKAFEPGLELLHEMVEEVAQGETIAGMGAAAGGPLDWRTGVISPLHQPEWNDVPMRELMGKRYGCPFFVDVDTNVAALAEYYALENPPRLLLYLTLSTGMGGGLVVDGQLYRGLGGEHPEVAHQSIPYRCMNPDGLHCACGAPDCLEALISGNGIRRIYGKPAENLNDEEWAEVAYNLGQGLRNMATIYLPDEIVLGGGVAVGGGVPFIQQATEIMKANLNLVPHPTVRLSTLGYDTALQGAVEVAIRGLE